MNLCLKYNIFSEMHIKKLIIGDMHPDKIDFEKWGIVSITHSLLKLDLSKIQSRKEADEVLKNDINSELMRSFLLSNLIVKDNKLEWKMDLISIANSLKYISDFKEYETSFKNSALFLKGEKSNGMKEHHFIKINKYFPNNQVYIFKDTGHWLNYEKPDEFLDITKKFF